MQQERGNAYIHVYLFFFFNQKHGRSSGMLSPHPQLIKMPGYTAYTACVFVCESPTGHIMHYATHCFILHCI